MCINEKAHIQWAFAVRTGTDFNVISIENQLVKSFYHINATENDTFNFTLIQFINELCYSEDKNKISLNLIETT